MGALLLSTPPLIIGIWPPLLDPRLQPPVRIKAVRRLADTNNRNTSVGEKRGKSPWQPSYGKGCAAVASVF
jgi:hypothetical protein